ncbi:MAG: hypothetical protein HY360_01120 [Verrucomicrobia bacterium]|nr:hypothetical protein [Verrucomicrobiota bacterium]
MPKPSFLVRWMPRNGLTFDWATPVGLRLAAVSIRLRIRGSSVFYVWGGVDSGEGPPLWAEPKLDILLFGPASPSRGIHHRVEPVGRDAWRVIATGERAEATLDLALREGDLRAALSIRNPQKIGGRPLPLCAVELRFGDLDLGSDAIYTCAHSYGGGAHGHREIRRLEPPGVSFVHGCIGQALPLVYLHSPGKNRGLQFEFMLNERPMAWLRPSSTSARAHWCVAWSTERLLEPGQIHAYGGALGFSAYTGRPVQQMRRWRDAATERYGLVSPPTPKWARRANIIEWNMNPKSGNGFTRLDDPKARTMLERWKGMGYTAIFAVSCNHVGQNWLSPFDYAPCKAVGGQEAEKVALRWAHELGFHIFLWVTTVGMDRDAPEVREHRDWFTHRPNGALFYAWDSRPDNNYIGYAPDADPLSAGWRQWLKDQVSALIARGYDGIYVDGCIPRASNHARWSWPGEGRNGVENQVRDLAAHVRRLGKNLITFVEDESLSTQTAGEVVQGRYHPVAPAFKKESWDHGMGGGPKPAVTPPARIPPEMARDYLLIRYASLLPGVVSNDILEGYISEAARPWTVQSLMAGIVPKTHSEYVSDPGRFRPLPVGDKPPDAEQEPNHRRRGHQEFVELLQFCRDKPLVREAPRSIEGVLVEGDAAVVGLLRPSPKKALLTLIQFANRPARVSVRLADPADIPVVEQAVAGQPHRRAWRAQEILRSMVDKCPAGPDTISGDSAMGVNLAPFGFRIFMLTPLIHSQLG